MRKLAKSLHWGGFYDCSPALRVPADGIEMKHPSAAQNGLSVCRGLNILFGEDQLLTYSFDKFWVP